jgi:F-type H+-transporting ATPase subunit gamma
MPTPRDIKRRIVSVKNTQKITKAMQMVASVKLRKARDRAVNARPYFDKLTEMARHLIAGIPQGNSPYLRSGDAKNVRIVVVGSDKGLCGAFNANAVKKAMELVRENRGKNITLTIVGKKPAEAFKRRHVVIADRYVDMMFSPKYPDAETVGLKLLSEFVSGSVDEIVAVYNEFRSPASHWITAERIFPLPPPEEAKGPKASYIFEPSPEETFDVLMPQYMVGRIWKIFLESNAAQQAASMTNMYAATKNAGKLIDSLTLYYNKVRQSIITKELLEVVSGAEALR